VIWATVVVALLVAWSIERQRPRAYFWKGLAEACIKQLEREGCEVNHNEAKGEWDITVVVPHAFAGDEAAKSN
jgi:hypothetical protein